MFTGLEDTPISGTMAIKGNRICDIGPIEEMDKYIGPETKVYNFQEQLIMPGFNDFHIHLFAGSLAQESVSLINAKSEEEAAKMVKVFADTRPNDPWIFGFRWYHIYWTDKKLPRRETLDRYISDRPVFLFNDECHGAWLNSKALEMLNIDKDTPNPPFGEIMKDENGIPTGFLYETAMGFAQKAFNLPYERRVELMKKFLKKSAELGITSVSDMLPLPGLQMGDLELYKQFEEDGNLTTRIHFLAELDGDLDYPMKLRKNYNSKKLKFSGLKQFLDGVPFTHTAYLTGPYTDRPESKGITLIPPNIVKKWVREADKLGFRIRLHACGDGAVRLGLDSFEEAIQKNGERDARHTIEHVELIHPDDIPRFAELNIIASMQPEHMAPTKTFDENPFIRRYGENRSSYTFMIRTLKKQGTKLAFGTDYPVVDINPMLEIYRAVTRKFDDGQPDQGWNPQEKISLVDALKFYTSGSAYGTFSEEDLGTLEPGKLADVIVLDKNLFEESYEEILNTRVRMTIMDGQVVFNRGKG
jgi:predicted amidohydrolase YtcJ